MSLLREALSGPTFIDRVPPAERVRARERGGESLSATRYPGPVDPDDWNWPKAEPIPTFYDWRNRNWLV